MDMRRGSGRLWGWVLGVAAVGYAASAVVGCSSGTATLAPGLDASADSNPHVDASKHDSGIACTEGKVCSGVCVKTATDVDNCGACGKVCPAGDVCSTGTCGLYCGGGTSLCGTSCSSVQSDPANCGTCGHACMSSQVCSLGACALTCGGGTTKCGSSCVDEQVDPANCGGCGTVCAAGEVCSAGACKVSCATGLTLCGASTGTDGGAPDAGTTEGLCVNTGTDRFNCGQCGKACASGLVCNAGACVVSCPVGEVNCNGKCIDPKRDNEYCGAGGACAPGDGGTAGESCVGGMVCNDGVCSLSCQTGLTNCSGTCDNLKTDPNNCGACGTVCPAGQQCSAGVCGCPTATPNACGTGASALCTSFQTDPNNCGACGTVCGAGELCSHGACGVSCVSGETACPAGSPTYCADTTDDARNCGGCGTVCPGGQQCSASTCACAAATPSACGSGASAFCTSFQTDPANCGGCGMACPQGETCSAGTCSTVCAPGLTTCGNLCVDTTSDSDHCGSCGTVCPLNQSCTHGECCGVGNTYCGGQCIDTYDNPANCGGCGVTCGASAPICVHGACAPSCPAGFTLVGGQCSMTYIVSFANATGFENSNPCVSSPTPVSWYGYSYWEQCGSDLYEAGENSIVLSWTDTALAAGFLNVSSVSVAFQTENYASLEIYNPPATTTFWTFTESVALDGQPIGTYTEGETSSACPGSAAQNVSLSATTAAQLSGYQVGGVNTLTLSHPPPATCTPSQPGGCCFNEFVNGLDVNTGWGPTALAQITVVY